MIRILGIAALSLAVAGCGTLNNQVADSIDKSSDTVRDRFQQVGTAPVQPNPEPPSRVSEVKGKFMPAMAVSGGRAGEWLRQMRVKNFTVDNPVPLSAIQKWLTENQINVVSDMPLDNVTFAGKINATDAETALKMISGSVGLDFVVDDARRLVTIRPMASKTWVIHIGNRKSSYTSADTATTNGQTGAAGGAGATGNTGLGGASFGSAGAMAGGMPGANALGLPGAGTSAFGGSGSGAVNTGANGQTGNGTNLLAFEDFWVSLQNELARRLKVMIPKDMLGARFSGPASAAVPGINDRNLGQVGGSGGGQDLYVEKQIGTFSINPETGAVTVQAPNWILRDLDTYIKTIQAKYNTEITFIGEVLLVTTTNQESEGVDLAGFASWAAGRYGAIISNNALGGITVSGGAGGANSNASAPTVVAGSQSVGGALAGLTYAGPNNAFNLFNAYLAQRGNVSIVQKPTVSTTSGVAGIFEKKKIGYYNTVSQQASVGSVSGATTATQNIIVQYETGTELRVIPHYDVATNLIRAPLTFNMVIETGSKIMPQAVSSNNTVQMVNQVLPILAKYRTQGEVLLKDGDMIIVGGQVDDHDTIDNNGLPAASGGAPIGGIFGVKKASKQVQTFYVALRVVVTKR